MRTPVLQVRNLSVVFNTRKGVVKALNDVSFDIHPGEVFGLVGETGCGKSVTALSILRLVPPPGRIVSGEILFEGTDLLRLSAEGIRRVRGAKIAMVFQDPMTYLNPVLTVGTQIVESLELYGGSAAMGHQEATSGPLKSAPKHRKEVLRGRAVELLRLVGMPQAEDIVDRYPHELSGGMRQRCMIAMALARNPRLLIADEPTTALDVITQAKILEILVQLKGRLDLSVLLITHDLGIVAHFCDRIGIMYAGSMAEIGPCHRVLEEHLHPYTQGLIEAIPRFDRKGRLQSIVGSIPDMRDPPPGCAFHPRCPHAMRRCTVDRPAMIEEGPDHVVACHLYPREVGG